jgi:hypothetical protein
MRHVPLLVKSSINNTSQASCLYGIPPRKITTVQFNYRTNPKVGRV